MKVGDLVRYTKEHTSRPGFDYCADWTGIIVEKIVNSRGATEELHIIWNHGGKVSDYPSSWWNRLPYEPFEVVSESR